MEAEHFSMNEVNGGYGLQSKVYKNENGTLKKIDICDTPVGYQHYGVYLLGKSARWVARFMVIFLILATVVMFLRAVPESKMAWAVFKDYKNKPLPFTQKENLQWLGASADVVRGDYENNQDSLAEKSMRSANRVTDLNAPVAATKATFYSRERMSTPEEEELKKLRANM